MTTPNDPYGQQPGYGPPPGWAQGGGFPPYGPPVQTSTKAVVALVLAIGSFAVCPVIPAIVALVLASAARQEILASGGRLSGEGLVTAARIISWVNLGLAVLGIAAIVLLVVVAGSSSTTY